MGATGYTVWKALFPKEETLRTEFEKRPFYLRDVTEAGIELGVPVAKANDRTLILNYGRLDALWEKRSLVRNSLKEPGGLTSAANRVWDRLQQRGDSQNEAQYWALVCERERRELDGFSVSLRDEEADRAEPGIDSSYNPEAGDQRRVIERQIRERRGQQQFREALLKRHGGRCLVTGCTVLAVLEAAHIKPYQGENDNHPQNGLLLRSDIHTLFDLNLLGIEPERLQVEIHPSLAKEYGHLAGKPLDCARPCRPSDEALRLRYDAFHRWRSSNV